MTNTKVRALRKNTGLSAQAFAVLIGVSPSSVSRWESDEPHPKIDPGTLAILTVLESCFENKPSGSSREVFAADVERALSVGGRLRALHLVLSDHFGDAR